MRKLIGLQKTFVGILLVFISAFYLYTAITGVMEPRLHRSIHMTFLLSLSFLLYPATKKSPKDRFTPFDFFLSSLSFITGFYIILNAGSLNWRLEHITEILPIEVIFGTITCILVVEGIRRAVVPTLAYLVAILIAYMFVCPFLPGLLKFKQLPYARIIENLYLLKDEGIYGSLTGITATFVALFIIFGAFLQNTGISEFFINLSCKLAGKSVGGPAKIAVVASGFFGSISGVAVANVYGTGTFTIPLMKELGYPPLFAGAVEAAASTGGMIMPPVMGVGAFVMSEITGIPYATICISAALGAIFYYSSIGLIVHFQAIKLKLRRVPDDKIVSWREIIKKSYMLLPLFVLICFMFKGYSPFSSAFYSILATIVVNLFDRKNSMTIKKFIETLKLGGEGMIMVAIAVAGAGIIISVIVNSGLGLALSSIVVSFSQGNLLFALVLIMLTTMILGMGLPCTPAYIIAISIGGPALLKMGINVLNAHLFVFYFAILAEVTPPVALAAYAAASLSKADPIKTGWTAFTIAISGFIVPYMFIYSPAILLQGNLQDIFLIIILLSSSVFFLSIGVVGYFKKILRTYERIIMCLVSLFLLFPINFLTKSQEICLKFFMIFLLFFYLNDFKIKKIINKV